MLTMRLLQSSLSTFPLATFLVKQLAGKLRCVPSEKRAEIRRKVSEIIERTCPLEPELKHGIALTKPLYKVVALVERQLPPVTHEAWRYAIGLFCRLL